MSRHHTYLLSLPLLACVVLASGCTATETEFHIGTIDDIKLSPNPTGLNELRLTADGSPKEIKVTSNVKWEIDKPEHPFTAIATSTDGDGVITVSSSSNINTSESPEAKLTVRAVEFPEKYFTISLKQLQLMFQMDEDNYPETPEQGGEVDIKFKSSIDWTLKMISGDSQWLSFNPSDSGTGSWEDIEVKALWNPNYSLTDRVVSLVLTPTDTEWLEQGVAPQKQIDLIQKAGTLPYDIKLTASEAEKTSVALSIHYASKSPVDKVEIKVSNSASLEEATFVTVPNSTGEQSYPETCDLGFTLENLLPGTPYIMTPIITSKVGSAEGEPQRVQTRGDIVFNYPDLATVEIRPTETGVEAFFKTISEIELTSFTVTLCQSDGKVLSTQSGRITSELDETNTPVKWIGELTWDNNVELSQNTPYYFDLVVTANDPNRPDVQNTIKHNLGYQHFTTLFRLPEQGDNQPIK